MSGDDETLDEWMRTAAALAGERLNAMDDGPLTSADAESQVEEGHGDPDLARDSPTALTENVDGRADADGEIRPVPVFGVLTEPESSDSAPKRGRWEVVTEASRYELDLDREMLRRVRGTVKPGPEVAFPAKLRDHDRGWIRLLRIIQLEVGKPAIFDIESLGGPDMLFTRRSTTYVLSIRQLGDSEPFD